jgi:hypothetical protein
VNAQAVILSRHRDDADPAFGGTEETTAACIVGVFAEKLDAPGNPKSEHHSSVNTGKPHESAFSPFQQRLLARRFVRTHARCEEL